MDSPSSARSRFRLSIGVSAALIFLLNLWICWPLLFVDVTAYFGSVEPAFYVIADGIRERFPESGWLQQWNLGIPFNYTYAPLLHHLVAGTGALGGWSSARAFHIVQALLYCLGPVALYLLMRRLTANQVASFAGAVAYSLLSPSTWIIPSLAADTGGYFAGRRLYSAVFWGDGPHVAGLALLPFALLAVDRAIEKGTPVRWIVAAFTMSLVPFTNIPAALALTMGLAAFVLAMAPRAWIPSTLKISAAAIAGYVVFSPWMPPSSLLLTSRNVQLMEPNGRFSLEKLPYYLSYLAIVAVVAFLTHRAHLSRFTKFAAIFTTITVPIVAINEFLRVDILSQPNRFHLVMEIALALLLATGFAWITRISQTRLRWAIAGVLVIAAVGQTVHLADYARERIRGENNLEAKSEYQVSNWLKENADGHRAYVTGATSLWLDYWTDVPELTGCCDQNRLLPVLPAAIYAILSDDNAGDRAAEVSIAWFKTFGIRYIAISSEGSTEPYKDMAHPHKFDGVLPEVWRGEGDAIYEIPEVSKSLADLVWPDEVIVREPVNGLDIEPLQPYIRATEDHLRPQASFAWEGTFRARIEGLVPSGALLSVRIPYHAGWSASSPQGAVALSADALGMLVVDPSCNGTCEVDLVFNGGAEAYWLRIVSLTTLALMVLWVVRDRARVMAHQHKSAVFS